MGNRRWDLVVVLGVAVLAIVATVTEGEIASVRFLLGVALVCIVPGYALTALLFPRGSLAAPERILWILGLSLATVVLGGLALNALAWDLQPDSWAIFLGGVTLIAGLGAALRRSGASIPHARGVAMGFNPGQSLLMGASILVVVGAIVLARGAAHQASMPFTQLWVLPAESTAQAAVQVGVHNSERTMTTYAIQVKAGERTIYRRSGLLLNADRTWERLIPLPSESAPGEPVSVELYLVGDRAGDPIDDRDVPYRRAVLYREGEGL